MTAESHPSRGNGFADLIPPAGLMRIEFRSWFAKHVWSKTDHKGEGQGAFIFAFQRAWDEYSKDLPKKPVVPKKVRSKAKLVVPDASVATDQVFNKAAREAKAVLGVSDKSVDSEEKICSFCSNTATHELVIDRKKNLFLICESCIKKGSFKRIKGEKNGNSKNRP